MNPFNGCSGPLNSNVGSKNLFMNSTREFVDDYEHLDSDLVYTLENVLSENVLKNINECDESKKLYELFNTLLLNKCNCKDECLQQCSHGTNYIFNEDYRELVLKDNQHSPDLIYECSNICRCEQNCHNRLVQYGPRKFLKIIHSPLFRSNGLITLQDIPKGGFICEYAGELLTEKEAKAITRLNEIHNVMNYVLYLNETCISHDAVKSDEKCLTIVNPSKKGNIGRYLNHSCDPNCRMVSIRIDSPIPKIAFFSKRLIKVGEEICFDYNEGISSNKKTSGGITCLCASRNCFKYLPNSEF